MEHNRQRGFTLIELLVVVTIILIIAAFAIPKIGSATMPAHESAAVAGIRAVNAAEMIYANGHPAAGFTPDLPTLGGAAGGDKTIDEDIAEGHKSKYTFTYTPGEKVNGAISSYSIIAVPDKVGTTGNRRFYSDESGEVRYNASGPADASSPLLQ